MRGGVGLMLGMPPAAADPALSLSLARLDWKLLAAVRLGLLGALPGGGLGDGGLTAQTTQHRVFDIRLVKPTKTTLVDTTTALTLWLRSPCNSEAIWQPSAC